MVRWRCALGPVVAIALVSGAGVRPAGAAAPGIEALLDSVRTAAGIPALAAVVVRGDSAIELAAVGVRRKGDPDRVTVHDLFHIGSMMKAMTATLAARFVERGALAWSTTPAEVFPELRDSMTPEFRDVTVLQLLGHSAGLPAFEDDGDFPHLEGSPLEQRRAFVARVLSGLPLVPPGTEHRYSNAGPTVVAAMLERLSGQPFESLMREEVFAPLGMQAVFGWPGQGRPGQPCGHAQFLWMLRVNDPNGSYHIPAAAVPAGDLSASLADYARFMRLHLVGLRGDDGILRASTIGTLHTPVAPVGPGTGWALGWGVQDIQGVLSHAHDGSAGTFYSVVALQPTQDLGVAVFANAGGGRAEKASRTVLKLLLVRYRTAGPVAAKP